jgi:asparagine synthetase B (glutamine-hydrolysing)
MLLAVVHVRGRDAARAILKRAGDLAGEPSAETSLKDAVIAGWRSTAELTLTDDCAVEGFVAGPERPYDGDFDGWLGRTNGDFALIAAQDGALIAASGPAGGHRPLFVAVQDEWSVVSTRLRAVVSLLPTQPKLDFDYMTASLLAVEYPIASTATPYQGVMHLPLGEVWSLRAGREEERRSIRHLPLPDVTQADERGFARMLRKAIESSVERSTYRAAKVGVMLSGGVDSSSILVTLEHLRRSGRVDAQVEAYSWDFETLDPGDDRPFRRAVEQKMGRASHPVAPEHAGRFVRRALVLDAAPCTDAPCALWLALDAAASARGDQRIVTGIGGDNVLEGDAQLLGDLGRRGSPIRAVRKALALRGTYGNMSSLRRLHEFVLRPVARALAPEPLKSAFRAVKRKRRLDWMGPRFRSWIDKRNASPLAPRLTLESSPAERYAALARMPFLSDQTIIRSQQEDVMRCRRVDPLFDDEILRVVAALPPLALMAGDRLRGLMRQSVSDLLPKEVSLRTNKAYMDPALATMVEAAGGFMAFQDLACVTRLADLGLAEPKLFRAHFDRLARQPVTTPWWSVWPALAAEEFLRQYDEGWTP